METAGRMDVRRLLLHSSSCVVVYLSDILYSLFFVAYCILRYSLCHWTIVLCDIVSLCLSVAVSPSDCRRLCATVCADLDLSFAYTGYVGAEVLSSLLTRPDCQLVRLCLAGNALGDQAMEVLSGGVQRSKTLWVLDVRSNAFTGRGLGAVCGALVQGAGRGG